MLSLTLLKETGSNEGSRVAPQALLNMAFRLIGNPATHAEQFVAYCFLKLIADKNKACAESWQNSTF